MATTSPHYTWRELFSALKERNALAMLLLGLSAGLPYVLMSGTLFAWFTAEQVSVKTIGVVSWITIIISFKFLWSPAIDRAPTPKIFNMGQRRAGIFMLQGVVLACLFCIAGMDPKTQIGLIALTAVICTVAFASADILIDAWRIEVADEKVTIDLLSALYQLGYRTAALLGGAGALIMAPWIGWYNTFLVLTALMAVAFSGVFLARNAKIKRSTLRIEDAPPASLRNSIISIILASWTWAIVALFGFMAFAVNNPDLADAREFTREKGPFIILATIIGPAILAAIMRWLQENNRTQVTFSRKEWPGQPVFNVFYASILEPLDDLIQRLKWGVVLVLAVALSYRFVDLIWGGLAYPFYLGENFGALGHTMHEVAIASKMFGAVMTFVGIGVGSLAILRIGRMPCLVAGAVLAASTNLLFADLALGAPVTDSVMSALGLYYLFGFVGPLASAMQLDVAGNEALVRLMLVIGMENLAVGFASACIVVYLSSIVNKKYAAVQYAILGSLGFLLGSLGRAAMGELVEERGFAFVFFLTAAMGMFAVLVTILEWLRQIRYGAPDEIEAKAEAAPAE